MSDPLHPTAALLAKLGSIIVHFEEAQDSDGHAYDVVALNGLLEDPEVRHWLRTMDRMAMLPKKRSGIL